MRRAPGSPSRCSESAWTYARSTRTLPDEPKEIKPHPYGVELGRLITREMGKVKVEALGDVQEAIDMAYYMAGEGRRLFGNTTPSELPNKVCMTLREPIGVCGMITPWNFPIAIPSWKSLPALVCGKTR